MKKSILGLLFAAAIFYVCFYTRMDKILFEVMEFVFLSMYLIWLQQIDGKEFCNKKGDVTVSRAILVFTSRVISMSLLLFVAIESFVLYTVGVTQIFLGILTLVVLVLGGSSILLWFGENDSE